jgi:hypothetical protein
MSIVSYTSALAPAMAIIYERTIFRLRLNNSFLKNCSSSLSKRNFETMASENRPVPFS